MLLFNRQPFDVFDKFEIKNITLSPSRHIMICVYLVERSNGVTRLYSMYVVWPRSMHFHQCYNYPPFSTKHIYIIRKRQQFCVKPFLCRLHNVLSGGVAGTLSVDLRHSSVSEVSAGSPCHVVCRLSLFAEGINRIINGYCKGFVQVIQS